MEVVPAVDSAASIQYTVHAVGLILPQGKPGGFAVLDNPEPGAAGKEEDEEEEEEADAAGEEDNTAAAAGPAAAGSKLSFCPRTASCLFPISTLSTAAAAAAAAIAGGGGDDDDAAGGGIARSTLLLPALV